MSSQITSDEAGLPGLGAFGFAGDDAVVPFHVEALDAIIAGFIGARTLEDALGGLTPQPP